MKKLFVSISAFIFCLSLVSSVLAEEKPYPLKVCIVSDQTLGSMGTVVEYNHEGQIVKFCCSGCLSMFKADPDKYLDKLKKAVEANIVETGE